MLSCKDVPDIASDYISHAGSPRSRLTVAIHLAQCSNCRAYVRGLKKTRSLAADSFRGPVPLALLQDLGLEAPDRAGSPKEPKA